MGAGQEMISSDNSISGMGAVCNLKTVLAGGKSLTYNFATYGNPAFQAVELVKELCAGETPTDTPTATLTRTATKTITSTRTATGTSTSTPSSTITKTDTASPTISLTYTVSDTHTITQTHSVTNTITPTSTITQTSSITPTSTVTMTSTVQPCGALYQASTFIGNFTGSYLGNYNTPSGSGRMLMVHVFIQSSTEWVTSAKYNGVNLIQAAPSVVNGEAYLWTGYLVNPPQGNNSLNVVKSGSGLGKIWAVSYAGVRTS